MDSPQTRAPRSHRRGWWLLLGAVLLAGVAWWWSQPRYHLVGTYATAYGFVAPFADGFLTHEGAGHFTCYDWQGRSRWHVVVPDSPYYTPIRDRGYDTDGKRYALSPDGHYFAYPVLEAGETSLLLWHDGRQMSKVRLPVRCDCLTLDNTGRALVSDNFTRTVAVEGQRIIARGQCLPTAPPPKTTYRWVGRIRMRTIIAAVAPCRFSPDGTRLAVKDGVKTWACYRISVNGDKMTFAQRGTIPDPQQYWAYALTPSPTAPQRGQVRNPSLRDAWPLRAQGKIDGGETSVDGRFAVVRYPAKTPVPVQLLRGDSAQTDTVLALFARPGIPRGTVRVHPPAAPSGQPTTVLHNYPSPDGRALVVTVTGEYGDGSRLFLYRR